jgi:hypothetical protein
MATKSAARRVSAIRHVAPSRSDQSPLGTVAMFVAFTLAILLVGVTISAAQAIS